MRRFGFLIFALAACCCSGCQSNTATKPGGDTNQLAGRSIQDMQAEWDRYQAEHNKKCFNAPPDIIKANQQVCAEERERMIPLGNALMEAKVRAAQHATNP